MPHRPCCAAAPTAYHEGTPNESQHGTTLASTEVPTQRRAAIPSGSNTERKSTWSRVAVNYIEEYCSRIKREGHASVIDKPIVVGKHGAYSASYVPFEHTNTNARLVLVGTTPGHTHIKRAAELTATMLRARHSGQVIQREHKRQVEMGDPLARPNLLRMLDHFHIPALIGVADAATLWDDRFDTIQPLALLPLATTRRGLAFDGSFDEVLGVTLLREQFEALFLARLSQARREALYIAFGRIAWAALTHAAASGVIHRRQMLGMMPVPTRAGTMVRYFLREISAAQLSKHDPVRHRVAWLDDAHEQLAATLGALRNASRATDPQHPAPPASTGLAA
jgi:hypothetical protein